MRCVPGVGVQIPTLEKTFSAQAGSQEQGTLQQSLQQWGAELGSWIDLIYCTDEVWKVENYLFIICLTQYFFDQEIIFKSLFLVKAIIA